MEENRGQSSMREEEVLFVFANEGKRLLQEGGREATWDTLAEGE